MDGLELRRANSSDAAEIAGLYLASFHATYDFPLAHSDDAVLARKAPDVTRVTGLASRD